MFDDVAVGQRFGRLVVMELQTGESAGAPCMRRLARCVCDCGAEKTIRRYLLTRGSTASCGCARRNRAGELMLTHGHAKHQGGGASKTYRAWANMRSRCTREKDVGYANYGGRGITFDPRWNSFEALLDDMGECPPDRSLDRIDVNGNYEPGNCRWADAKTQRHNQRPYRPTLVNASLEDLLWAVAQKISATLTVVPHKETP